MLTTVFTAAALGVAAIAALPMMLFTVREKQEALVTSFGKLIRTEKNPGLRMKMPWHKVTKVGTDLQQESETLETKTKDDLFVKLPIAIQFEITDTGKYFFSNRDAVATMKKSVSAAVRTASAGREFQELYGDRDEISTAVIDHIKKDVEEFGINLRRIIIDEPTAPQEVQNAFNEVRASERLREAAKNKAEAHKIEVVARAEAEKTADVLRGQGKAGYRKEIFDQYSAQIGKLVESGTPREEAISVMMRAMEQDTLRDVGEKGNLVIVNNGGTGGASGIAEVQTLGKIVERAIEQNNNQRQRPSAPPAATL
jgi:regulator of protease activity HflC (stomatin/prohibitin superfamily)